MDVLEEYPFSVIQRGEGRRADDEDDQGPLEERSSLLLLRNALFESFLPSVLDDLQTTFSL